MIGAKQPGTDTLLSQTAVARALLLVFFHSLVFAACFALAYLVRFDFSIPPEYFPIARAGFVLVISVQLLAGAACGFYRGWWRYVGISDVVRLVVGISAAATVLTLLWFTDNRFPGASRFVRTPRGVILIDWSLTLLTLFGVRLIIRMGRDRFRPATVDPSRKERRVLIIGAGDAGESLAREIEHRPQLGKVVAFVDDQRAKWRSNIRGIEVRGPISSIAAIADELGADEALIAIPSASGKRIREIIRYAAQADLQFKTIPGIDHIVIGKVHVTHLRPVNVEDLLRRKRIDLPGDPARAMFHGRRVLVTGAGGTIGSELATQIAQLEPATLVLVERCEYALYEIRKRFSNAADTLTTEIIFTLLDICDTELLDELIEREKPHIVLHAAAHKHVPLGEENPREYIRNNCVATRALAEICASHSVERMVFISTDKAINPSSVMGATKRAAEIALLDLAAQTSLQITIVRFGNVIGSSGSAIPLFIEQIAAGGPLTITHPHVSRYFLRTSEAVSLVLQAATLGSSGQVFMLDMGEPVKIVDLVRDLLRLSNHTEEDVPIVFIGLRPGEKLFEEIRLDEESIHKTVHPHIVITEAPQPEHHLVSSWLSRARNPPKNREASMDLLATLIAEYTPDRDISQHAATDVARAGLLRTGMERVTSTP